MNTLRVYYKRASGMRNVSSPRTREVTLKEAIVILKAIVPEAGFIGVRADNGFVLNIFHNKSGSKMLEVFDNAERTFYRCRVRYPRAERMVKAAFAGESLLGCAKRLGIRWQVIALPKISNLGSNKKTSAN